MKRQYYIFKNGILKRKDNSLIFKTEENSRYIPIEDVESIYAFGNLKFNTKLVDLLSQKGVGIHFFNYYGFYNGSFCPYERNNSGILLVKQVEHFSNNSKRIIIAREIVEAASFNMYRNLRYYNQRGKDLSSEINKLNLFREKIRSQDKITKLMGIEGNIREIYYSAFPKIINQKIDFKKRVKRPPDNMINSLISFINSLIYTTTLSEIYHTQLSPLISYLHEPGTKRFSLSLDLAEIFKPLIGERLIFSLLNKHQLNENDFNEKLNYIYLKDCARKKVLKEYDERLKNKIKHKKLIKNVSYRHLIRLEAYKLVKHLIGEKEYVGFKIWW